MTPFVEFAAEQFDRQFAVNVRGVLLHACLQVPLLKGGGTILITTSIAEFVGIEKGLLYKATKSALRTSARVVAKELARRNIRVNCLSLGPIETNFMGGAGMNESGGRRPNVHFAITFNFHENRVVGCTDLSDNHRWHGTMVSATPG